MGKDKNKTFKYEKVMKRTSEDEAFLKDALERYKKGSEAFRKFTEEPKNVYYLVSCLRMYKEIENSGLGPLKDKEVDEALEDIRNSTTFEDYVSKFQARKLKSHGAEG